MILRLPKWAQAKFREHLKKLEHQGQIMPSFKDVVNFLNDRADVANYPFFSISSAETKPPSSKRHDANDHRFATLTAEGEKEDSEIINLAVKTDRKKGVQFPMSTWSNRRLVSSIGRAPDCCAGGRRFEARTGPTLRVLK